MAFTTNLQRMTFHIERMKGLSSGNARRELGIWNYVESTVLSALTMVTSMCNEEESAHHEIPNGSSPGHRELQWQPTAYVNPNLQTPKQGLCVPIPYSSHESASELQR